MDTGKFFGELSILNQQRVTASVVVHSETATICVLSQQVVHNFQSLPNDSAIEKFATQTPRVELQILQAYCLGAHSTRKTKDARRRRCCARESSYVDRMAALTIRLDQHSLGDFLGF